jgi:hypothetical protein
METRMKFIHVFPAMNAHVQMEAPTPSPMKPADDSEQVLFREALREGRRRKTQSNP